MRIFARYFKINVFMACILGIETSTAVCSVAVSEDGVCVFEKEAREGPNHAVLLGVFIDEALSFVDGRMLALDAVAVSCGPGSYTGLRIGVSMAKGICVGRGIPLIGIPTLELLCVPLLLSDKLECDEALLCPMLDARRMEVYAGVYDRSLCAVRDVQPDVVDADTYKMFLDRGLVYFFGDGSEKCKAVITDRNARFVDDMVPLARWMFPLAEKRFYEGRFEDVAYFVPNYLKGFELRVKN